MRAGLRYSDPAAVELRLRETAERRAAQLGELDRRPALPFSAMADWGEDGRIGPDAPIHSPFISRRRNLTLE